MARTILGGAHALPMDELTATLIVEGEISPVSGDEERAAWQYLVDTGLAWKNVRHGKRAAAMLEEGTLRPAPKEVHA